MEAAPASVVPPIGVGLHDLAEEAYHGDPCIEPSLSCSLAKILISESPKHAFYQHPRLWNGAQVRKDVSGAVDYGSLGHALMLGKGIGVEIGDWDNWMTKDAKAFREMARSRGGVPVLRHVYDKAMEMSRVAMCNMEEFGFRPSFDRSQKEISAVCCDGGLWMRSKFDALDRTTTIATIHDLKITARANPSVIERQIGSMNYDLQDSFYRDVLVRIFPEYAGRVDFIFWFVENEFPFSVVPVRLNGEFRALGDMKLARAKTLWRMAFNTGVWPGYTSSPINVSPRPWDVSREVESSALTDSA